MSESRAISTRLIGEIFVERGLITHEQLAQALQVQSDSGGMLGEILVASFGVSRIALAGVLAEQWSAVERQPDVERSEGRPVSAAPTPTSPVPSVEEAMEEMARKPLGEIFVERGMATGEQLEHALEIQRESGERLGEILVRLGVIERLELAGALAEQWSGLQKLRPPAPKKVESWQELGGATGIPQDGGGGDLVSAPELKRIGDSVASLEQQVVALASRPDPDLTTLRATTRAVEERLADLEGRLHDIPAADALADVRSAVERLELAVGDAASGEALDEVRRLAGAATDGLQPRLDELAAGVTALAARVEELAGAELTTVRGSLDETRSLLDGLGARLEQVADRVADAVPRGDDDLLVVEQLEQRLGDAIGAVASRLDELDSRIPMVNDEPASLEPLRQTVEGLDARVSELAQGLEVVVDRPELDGLAADLRTRLARAEGLLGALDGRLDEVLARDPAAELDGALAERPTRAELDSVVAELRTRLDEVLARDPAAELDGALAERPTRAELDGVIAELRERLDEVLARDPAAELDGALADRPTRAELDGLVAELRNRLDEVLARDPAAELSDALAERPTRSELDDAVGNLGGRLAVLAASLDGLGAHGHELTALSERIVAVERSAETRGSELGDRIAELGAQLEALRGAAESTIHQTPVADVAALVAPLADRIAAVEHGVAGAARGTELAALAGDVTGQIDELRGSLDAVRADGSQALDTAVVELRGWLEAVQGRLDDAAGRAELAALAGDLRSRIDALAVIAESTTTSVSPELEELRGQVDGLGESLSGTVRREELDAHLTSLGGRLGDLSSQVAALGASPDGLAEDLRALRGELDELQPWITDAVGRGELSSRTSAIDTAIGALAGRLDELASRMDAAPARSDDLAGLVDGLAERLDASRAELRAEHDRRFEEARGRLDELKAELAGGLGGLRERVDGLPTAESLTTLEADVSARLDAIGARVDACPSAGRVDGLESALAELRGRIASLQAHVEDTAGADDLARIDAVLAGHDAALAERASSNALAETAAALDARLAALESGRESLDHQLADVPSRVELQAAVISLEGRLREDVEQRVAAAAANAAGADDVARLGAGLDSIGEELRAALAHLHGRIDELAAGQGHFGGRLAAMELAAGSSGAVDEVADDLAALRAEVERQAALADERTKVTERAIRKGLAGLGERLVASEQAYVEAGSSLRRAVERLGAAVVEADARLEGAPLDPPAGGHVAFVPTADGYRLRSVAGPAPAVDELVELVPGEAPFRVVRATLSPLPLDRRVCVYLEPVAPA